jgi:hypothetical protein
MFFFDRAGSLARSERAVSPRSETQKHRNSAWCRLNNLQLLFGIRTWVIWVTCGALINGNSAEDNLTNQKVPFDVRLKEHIKQRRFNKAEALMFASADASPDPALRLTSRINRLITEGRPRNAAMLLAQELPRFISPGKTGSTFGIASGPIERLVVHNGHPLMQRANADDLSAACSLPVTLTNLASAKPADFASPGTLIVLTGHTQGAEPGVLRALKAAAPTGTVVVWLFDNHHGYLANALTAAAADLCFPAHPMPADYLSPIAPGRIGPVVPLATGQWSRPELAALYARFGAEPRSEALSGHYAFYAQAHRRNSLIAQIMGQWPEAQITLNNDWSYHSESPENRFLRWRRFKTSVCLPVANDLSNRFFDALAAGQVPIVTSDILDLDAVIPAADQASLPVVRLKDYTVSALRAAHEEAVAAFDRDGEAGAERRHRYVVERHMLAHRIQRILRLAKERFAPNA